MKLTEAKQQFISSWGAFGTHWGINRTMAQIHALLLISADPMTQDDIMEELNISRGNTNMNIRELINWGLVERVILPGERKEFFSAEKDIWKVMKQIVKERKKRELDPMLKLLDQLEGVEGDGDHEPSLHRAVEHRARGQHCIPAAGRLLQDQPPRDEPRLLAVAARGRGHGVHLGQSYEQGPSERVRQPGTSGRAVPILSHRRRSEETRS